MRVGIDSGGTFTDIAGWDEEGRLHVAKIPSTPHDPAAATVAGFHRVAGRGEVTELRHGTTVPTNTLLERAGARTVLVATEGFRDVLEIARQRRPDLYDTSVNRVPALVPRERRFEVAERMDHTGEVLRPLCVGDMFSQVKAANPESIAICCLHAYANDAHEREIEELLVGAGDWHVVRSSEVAPELREFERMSTTVLHAYLGPGTSAYLHRLATTPGLPERVMVMRSAGGLSSVSDLALRPADALLSGPAAGALAAAAVAEAAGRPQAVSFDMGGTSTDVCLIEAGRPALRTRTEVGGYPCLSPALAVHTVGAGGGSIASFDAGGALQVGPASAGALPGPACYGRGGTFPTVTDANLVLGRLRVLAGGEMKLDRKAAFRAIDSLGEGAADAVVSVVEATMDRALRAVTVQKGVFPSDLALVAFGGAGGLHAASLARSLGAKVVIVPPMAGVLSAVGLLAAPVQADRSQTCVGDLAAFDWNLMIPLADAVTKEVSWAAGSEQCEVFWSVDCRYKGQSYELGIPVRKEDSPEVLVARFHAAHERLNGYRRDGAPVQMVTLRARAEVVSPVDVPSILRAGQKANVTRALGPPLPVATDTGPPWLDRALLQVGHTLRGPLLVCEAESTTYVPNDFQVCLDELGNLILEER